MNLEEYFQYQTNISRDYAEEIESIPAIVEVFHSQREEFEKEFHVEHEVTK